MTPEIAAALEKAKTLAEVEDIYRPYKPKRKTRASIARARGWSRLRRGCWSSVRRTNPRCWHGST